jgi:hypothetical protein
VNRWFSPLAVALAVGGCAGILCQDSTARSAGPGATSSRAPVAGQNGDEADAADDDARGVTADDKAASQRPGKISRGKLLAGLARSFRRAWIQTQIERRQRVPPRAEDDPFPQGEPAEVVPEDE